MTIEFASHLSNYLDEQKDHRLIEGYPNPIKSKNLRDVMGIQIKDENTYDYPKSRLDKRDYDYPEVKIKYQDETQNLGFGTVNVDNTEPKVKVAIINNKLESLDKNKIKFYNCYGVWETQKKDSHQNVIKNHTLFLDDENQQPIRLTINDYTGIIAYYPNGEREIFGDIKQNNNNIENSIDIIKNEVNNRNNGTFEIETESRLIQDVTNVSRACNKKSLHYILDRKNQESIKVSDIEDSEGPTYTACVKSKLDYGNGSCITTIKHAIGLYINTNAEFSDKNRLMAVNHPDNQSVYKRPDVHYVCDVEDIEDLHIKNLNGDIVKDLDMIKYI